MTTAFLDQKICVGVLGGAHGVRGLMRLSSYTEEPEAIFDYASLTDETGGRVYVITPLHITRGQYVVEVEGIESREEADDLRGTKLYVDRADLPKTKHHEFYEADLQGLPVIDKEGLSFGTIIALHNYGAGPFLEIGKNRKDSFMLPFTDTFVPTLDIKARQVVIAPPEGWVDTTDADAPRERTSVKAGPKKKKVSPSSSPIPSKNHE